MKLDISENSDVWIYGSGTFAQTLIARLEDLGFAILGVIDHVNIGRQLISSNNSYSVCSLSEVDLVPESQIVLAVCNLYGDLTSISKSIGPDIQITSPVEVFQMFSKLGIQSQNYWLSTDFDLYNRSHLEMQSFREILGDRESRELFDGILNYRKHGNIVDLPSPRPLSEQYLVKEYLTPPKDLKIVDLGACQGENLEDFLAAGHTFVDGYLFEPDAGNLRLLRDRLESLNLMTLECHPFGAWNETTTLRFLASGNPAAALSSVGDVSINVVALDDFIPGEYIPNFVKMDIEGAEKEALEGMTNLIENHRPPLAISVYHKPSDLWTIGNFLNQRFASFYTFYLRMYGQQTFDTVLYAVPLPNN